MYAALQIAKYFVALCNNEEDGEYLSNLKLQKLLYYAQGFHLAIYGERLFREDVEAWAYGPVVPSVYRYYKQHSDGAIPRPRDFDIEEIDTDTRSLLDEVFQVYGQYSAWKLANMTHVEPPWKKAIEHGQSTEITDSEMIDHFKTLLQ